MARLSSPLFLCIPFGQFCVNIISDQFKSLFFEAGWLNILIFSGLLGKNCFRFFRGFCSPKLVKCIHIEGKVVKFAFKIGQRGVGVSVEGNKAAIAKIIEGEQVGFAIRSLGELSKKLDNIDEDAYSQMLSNVKGIRNKITNGHLLQAAVSNALN